MEEQKGGVPLNINPIYIVVFLIVILIMVGIFVYVKYYGINETESSDVDNFIMNFKDIINEDYSSNTQPNEELDLQVPREINEICFVNPDKGISGNIDKDFENLLKTNKNYNMFILPIKSFKIPYHRINHLIVLEKNPLCIKTNGNFKAYVSATNYKNRKYIELHIKQKSVKNIENKTIVENKTVVENKTNICNGICKLNKCNNYDTCMNITGICSIGYCCYGTCTEKQFTGISNKTICQNADTNDLCLGLNLAYGSGYQGKCCSEHKLCC